MTPNTEIDWVWHNALATILAEGQEVAPRGKRCLELIGFKTVVDMRQPILVAPDRRLGYKFMAAEAAWILSGDNRVSTIKPYAKNIMAFSDDGYLYNGAYGPKVIDQLSYICQAIAGDQATRQAVLTIWRPRPGPSKDIPCTVSIQWLVRDGKLHCIDYMRSSDIWLGWPYDIFNFSMLSYHILIILRKYYKVNLKPGNIILLAGSQHLYMIDLPFAERLVEHASVAVGPDITKAIEHLEHPDELVQLLWTMAQSNGALVDFTSLQEVTSVAT
jgi:thymidylate synthase